MGTNYYCKTEPCSACKQLQPRLHIGKSCRGWSFQFRAYPEKDIRSMEQWVDYLKDGKRQIIDEYGTVVSLPKFKETVRQSLLCLKAEYNPNEEGWTDQDGYNFSTREFC